MKNLLLIALLCAGTLGYGQSAEIKELLQLEDDRYFADRDSAYADPYKGLRKLIYGNKRFA